MYVIASALSFLGNASILFDRNSAATASVMYLATSSTTVVTLAPPSAISNKTINGVAATTNANIFIIDNVCRTNGGGVFWFRDPPIAFAAKSVAYVQVLSFFFFLPIQLFLLYLIRAYGRYYEIPPIIINDPW